MKKTSITFNQVSKSFYLQEDKTVKELLPSIIQGKSWMKKKIALKNISFSIRQGETVGIVGKNGAGKSTIMKLIAGVTYPSSGSVQVGGKVAPLIELTAGFHHELSGYENIFLNAAILGMHKKEIQEQVTSIIEFSNLADYIHVPLKRYSTGMQMRLAFSVAIHTNAPILLIDEVLAVGDVEFQEKCLRKLTEIKAETNSTIVFVSHDQQAVEKFCDRALLLEDGELVADGSPQRIFDTYNKN
ncbi:MAG: ABC transporter ATP-binding protein [Patescibacteria group bacterium]